MRLQRIQYDELSPLQQQAFNFHKAAAALAEYGFNCTWKQDADGTDFLAKHKDGKILKVQLTPRLIIKKKWRGKDIFVIFPVRREGQARRIWYLVCHDSLIKLIGETRTWLSSKDWRDKDLYSCPSPPEGILNELRSNVLVELS